MAASAKCIECGGAPVEYYVRKEGEEEELVYCGIGCIVDYYEPDEYVPRWELEHARCCIDRG